MSTRECLEKKKRINMHLEITTYIDCPNKCSYCPQDTLLEAYKGVKVMSLDIFRRILANTPKDVDIHFSGFSELFYNSEALDFIKEAKKEHEVVVYTTTKGMTDETVDALAHINFKEFVVHERGSIKLPFPHTRVVIDDSNKISRGGHLWDRDENKGARCKKSVEYRQNVVLPNGDVYLCCMDYGLEHKLVNLLEERFENLNRESKYNLCKKLEWYV